MSYEDDPAVLGVRLACAAEQVLVDVARDLASRLDEFDPSIEHPVLDVLPSVPKSIIKAKARVVGASERA